MAGEAAGEVELLGPRHELLAHLRGALGERLLTSHVMVDRLWQARSLAQMAEERRRRMPVITDGDLEDLRATLASERVSLVKAQVGLLQLIPTQCQIYLDKVTKSIQTHGVEGTIAFLKTSELVVDAQNYVIDGHHRWLSMMILLDGGTMVNVRRMSACMSETMPLLLAFSDQRHARNN